MAENKLDAVHQSTSAEAKSTEVRGRRRAFSLDYKRQILAEGAACKRGELGLMLRREGLYASTLNAWRKQSGGGSTGLAVDQKRGRKGMQAEGLRPAHDRLLRENSQLHERLRQAEIIIDVQKKLSSMLGLTRDLVAL